MHIAGFLNKCYSQAGCTGDIVCVPGSSARDCCAETNEGQSYGMGASDCMISQCIGKILATPLLHVFKAMSRHKNTSQQ